MPTRRRWTSSSGRAEVYNSLTGTVTFKDGEQLHLALAGVEWDLAISGSTAAALPEPGAEAKVFTFLHHREDQMKLYGFASAAERELFLSLLLVNGVGPRLVMRMLSAATERDIRAAVQAGDADALARVPGLGAKSAQKIILALRGKLLPPAEAPPAVESDVIKALTGMGFSQRQANEAVAAVAQVRDQQGGELDEAELLRAAIQRLGTTR